ncbi:hypothetical protein EMCRGX_G011728 [Ephydatia muelleri]
MPPAKRTHTGNLDVEEQNTDVQNLLEEAQSWSPSKVVNLSDLARQCGITRHNGEVISTFTAQKIRLIDIRRKLLEMHEKLGLLHNQSDDYFENLTDAEVKTQLEKLGEKTEGTPDELKAQLKSMNRTRHLKIWHDHSTISGHSHLLVTVACVTRSEFLNTTRHVSWQSGYVIQYCSLQELNWKVGRPSVSRAEMRMDYHIQQLAIHCRACGQRLKKCKQKTVSSFQCKVFAANLHIAFGVDTTGDNVHIHSFCSCCERSMHRAITAKTEVVHHRCSVKLFQWEMHSNQECKLFHLLEAACHQLDLELALHITDFTGPLSSFSKYSQELQNLSFLQAELEKAQQSHEELQNMATYMALVNGEKSPLAVNLVKQSAAKMKSVKALKAKVAKGIATVQKGFSEKEGPFVKQLDSALQLIGVQRQQYFGGAFVGNQVHKALKLPNVKTLCTAISQMAQEKLPHRIWREDERNACLDKQSPLQSLHQTTILTMLLKISYSVFKVKVSVNTKGKTKEKKVKFINCQQHLAGEKTQSLVLLLWMNKLYNTKLTFERIGDFLLPGEGVWWKRVPQGVEFLDGDDDDLGMKDQT